MLHFKSFKKAYIFLPFCNAQAADGGLIVTKKLASLLGNYLPTEIATYQIRETGVLYAQDLSQDELNNSLLIITWGPHIDGLLKSLKNFKVLYYAQSFGWDINISPNVPILCVSRYVMSQWSNRAPANQVFLMPPVIGKECANVDLTRDIDILVVSRKSSDYLLNTLLPELKKKYNVHVQEDYIPQSALYTLFNRSKVYIYLTPTILSSGGMEGFGLQPLEALICGCNVFSNINGGLCDYLEPSSNMSQLSGNSLDYDLHRISNACELLPPSHQISEKLVSQYSMDFALRRLSEILPVLDNYFSFHADIAKYKGENC